MNNDNKDSKMKIIFAEGCFDNFDGTQEELNMMIADLHSMVDDGSLFENSREVTTADMQDLIDSDELSEEDINSIMERIRAIEVTEDSEDSEVTDLPMMPSVSNTRH